jgi:hypothetical protein
VEVEIRGSSAELVAAHLAGLGDRIEIIRPVEVRDELARIGSELNVRYARR